MKIAVVLPVLALAAAAFMVPHRAAGQASQTLLIVPSTQKELIDFSDSAALRTRRPLLIAHRGGVVTNKTPECSLSALQAASNAGYDMVELDIRESKDGTPMIFHDDNLLKACGVATTIGHLTQAEALATSYLSTGEKIASLDQALALGRKLHLGVMLDIKDAVRTDLVQKIAQLVRKHRLEKSTVAISGHPIVRAELKGVALTPVTAEELKAIARGTSVPVRGYYWFGIPSWIQFEIIPKLQAAGALVIPAINAFRYENDPDRSKAREDVQQLLRIGVDGFQIDSAYQDFFGRPLPESG